MTQPIRRHLPYDTARRVYDLVEAYDVAAAEARTAVMTDDSIVEKTPAAAVAVDGVRQLYSAQLSQISDDLTSQYQAITTTARAALPTPAPGVEAILTRQAWWARTRDLLASGIPIRSVIANATDPEQLHSIAEEAPTAVQTRELDGPLDQLVDAIARRLAILAGPDAVAALDDLITAAASMDVLRPVITEAGHHIGATNYLHTSDADFADALAQYGLRPRR
jgi:hypothetical protein